jgi:tryptophan synthase alpha chain
MQKRLETTFNSLKQQGKKAFIPFISAGDPSYDTSLKLLKLLPDCGADIIELGVPFSDPMADGASVQRSSLRALKSGQTLIKTLQMVREFRKYNQHTPLILMGYYNPVYIYGSSQFLNDALEAGVDGLIMVDLPPEEDNELCIEAIEKNIDFIRLITPTTHDDRLKTVLNRASGFLYYISITGVTGTKTANLDLVTKAIQHIKTQTTLPIGVGFGIKTPEDAKNFAQIADAVIVGSAIVDKIGSALNSDSQISDTALTEIKTFITSLANAVHNV